MEAGRGEIVHMHRLINVKNLAVKVLTTDRMK
jgi:hypothetical protein